MENERNLFILRHAKSSWDEPDRRDQDRPLSTRGIRDIQHLAVSLRAELKGIDLIVSSHANRAIHTAILLASAADLPMSIIRVSSGIYEKDELQVLRVVHEVPSSYLNLMIVGHNPTFSYLATKLAMGFRDELPTSGLVRIGFRASSWQGIRAETSTGFVFHSPRGLGG